jgi:hypothetical protein
MDISNFGGAIGLAGAGSIFRHRERESLESGWASLNIHFTGLQEDLIRGLLSDPDHAKQVLNQFTTSAADIVLPIFRNSFMNGYTSAFLFLLGLSIAAFILIALLIKDIRREKGA